MEFTCGKTAKYFDSWAGDSEEVERLSEFSFLLPLFVQ
jgi:hypothetical protein